MVSRYRWEGFIRRTGADKFVSLFVAYCKRGESIFNKLSELVDSCKDLMADLRKKLADEEMMSNKIVRPGQGGKR